MEDFARLYGGLSQGDRIRVFSGGQVIGTGSFIRLEGYIVVWVDKHANMNFTDLRTSSIKQLTGGISDTPDAGSSTPH